MPDGEDAALDAAQLMTRDQLLRDIREVREFISQWEKAEEPIHPCSAFWEGVEPANVADLDAWAIYRRASIDFLSRRLSTLQAQL